MKKHTNFWLVMFLAISLALPVYSMAQSSIKLTLQSSSGDTISGAPVNAFSLGTDGNFVISLGGPFTSADLVPPIWIQTSGTCSGTPPVPYPTPSVTVIQGNLANFTVCSSAGATLSMPVSPEPGQGGATFTPSTGGTGTFTWNTGGTAPVSLASYLALFQASDGAYTSQLVVMIKVNPAETVNPPTAISPLAGTVNQAISFTASGATVSTQGHTVEYRFNWGDDSGWSNWGSSTQTHAYATTGQFTIQAQARCATDHVESTSYSTTVTISNVPTYTVSVSIVNSGGGSVSPMSVSGITSGGQAVFNVTITNGYNASVSEGTLSGTTWTITNVTSTHTATVTFTQQVSGEVLPWNWGSDGKIHVINGSPGQKRTYIFRVPSGTKIAGGNFFAYIPSSSFSFVFTCLPGYQWRGYAHYTGQVSYSADFGIDLTRYTITPTPADGFVPPGDYVVEITWIGGGPIMITTALRQ